MTYDFERNIKQTLAREAKEDMLRKLHHICGYTELGTHNHIILGIDSRNRQWFIRKGKVIFWDKTLEGVLSKALDESNNYHTKVHDLKSL
jgi:hypothetical protein